MLCCCVRRGAKRNSQKTPLTNTPLFKQPLPHAPQKTKGGWLLRYENDNTASTDTAYFDAKRSRLTFLVDYPEKPSQTDLEWIERCAVAF
jgi:hypothetical protein